MAQIIVQYGRPSRSSWAKSIWSSFSRIVMGQAIWETIIEVRLGEGFQLGMFIRTPWKGLFLSVYVDDIKLVGKKTNIDPMWEILNKEVDLGEPTSFFDHVHLGCIQRQCEISKDIVDNYRTMFESRIYAGGTKNIMFGKSMYFFVVLRHGGSCQEMCGTKLWVGEQNDSTTLQRIHSMHRWPPFQRRRIEIRWRIVKIMFSNCSEMLIFDTYWTIWYSLVREQACAIDLEMDQSLWQTIISFDLLQSSYMWIQTVLPCGKHCQTMRIGIVSRLRFLQDILRIQNPLRGEHWAFLEVIRFVPISLDV